MFHKLPTEILWCILEPLSPRHQIAFARTCKTAWETAAPLLFRSVKLKLPVSWEVLGFGGEGTKPDVRYPTVPFCQPRFSQYVRHVELLNSNPSFPGPFNYYQPSRFSCRGTGIAVSDGFNRHSPVEYAKLIDTPSPFLRAIPHGSLQSFTWNVPFCPSLAFASLGGFQNGLQYLSLTTHLRVPCLHPRDAIADGLCNFPNLKRFSWDGFQWYRDEAVLLQILVSAKDSLTELELTGLHSGGGDEVVAPAPSAFNRLTDSTANADQESTKALRKVRHLTLRNVKMNLRSWQIIKCLDLENLRTLILKCCPRYGTLLDYWMKSSSQIRLKTLHIGDCEPGEDSLLTTFLGSFSGLESLHFDKMLSKCWRKAGIYCQLELIHFDNDDILQQLEPSGKSRGRGEIATEELRKRLADNEVPEESVCRPLLCQEEGEFVFFKKLRYNHADRNWDQSENRYWPWTNDWAMLRKKDQTLLDWIFSEKGLPSVQVVAFGNMNRLLRDKLNRTGLLCRQETRGDRTLRPYRVLIPAKEPIGSPFLRILEQHTKFMENGCVSKYDR
ncbi:hypothetical protein B0T16DRAFT_455123 [Cercophora newfieldiana]|uniref:F-box domain-containing protein n=1 Tax=Cercophora newfieldiana TaxID=92897 RepID=A0AA40CV81_9PEZI|nr:hypothetical protein B0T16DRAFT_455123 [Cercophora newfieldiana]